MRLTYRVDPEAAVERRNLGTLLFTGDNGDAIVVVPDGPKAEHYVDHMAFMAVTLPDGTVYHPAGVARTDEGYVLPVLAAYLVQEGMVEIGVQLVLGGEKITVLDAVGVVHDYGATADAAPVPEDLLTREELVALLNVWKKYEKEGYEIKHASQTIQLMAGSVTDAASGYHNTNQLDVSEWSSVVLIVSNNATVPMHIYATIGQDTYTDPNGQERTGTVFSSYLAGPDGNMFDVVVPAKKSATITSEDVPYWGMMRKITFVYRYEGAVNNVWCNITAVLKR